MSEKLMNEEEKMLKGMIYDCNDPSLLEKRNHAHALCAKFNALSEDDAKERKTIIKELLPNAQEGIYITGPVFFDYGCNFHSGKNFYCNFNFSVLDTCPVYIGDNVLCGPNVSINTPLHPLIAEERALYLSEKGYMTDKEYGKSISIGSNCWIAANVTIIGGAKIGNNCVIGAGSVVTGEIPDGYLAYGIPAKPIRKITKEDSIYLKKGLF